MSTKTKLFLAYVLIIALIIISHSCTKRQVITPIQEKTFVRVQSVDNNDKLDSSNIILTIIK